MMQCSRCNAFTAQILTNGLCPTCSSRTTSTKHMSLTQDQIVKHDKGKPRISLVPTQMFFGIAAVREYGLEQYPGDKDNWRKVEPERFIDALLRHALAFGQNPTGIDDESGLPHLWHLMCNGAFLCELLELKPKGANERCRKAD